MYVCVYCVCMYVCMYVYFFQHFELDSSIMNIALETYQSEGKQLTSVGQTLKSEGFFRKHTVSGVFT